MLSAVEKFDEQVLDSTYNDALSLYPVDVVNQRLVTPLLRIIGEHWKERDTGIAEEHFFSVYLRNKLGARIHHLNQRSHGPLLILVNLIWPVELDEGLLAVEVLDPDPRSEGMVLPRPLAVLSVLRENQ